jgi:hypothetical protein
MPHCARPHGGGGGGAIAPLAHGAGPGHTRKRRTEWSRLQDARVWLPSPLSCASSPGAPGAPRPSRHCRRVTAAQCPTGTGTTSRQRHAQAPGPSTAAEVEGPLPPAASPAAPAPRHNSITPDSRPMAAVQALTPVGGRVGSTATAVTAVGKVATVDNWAGVGRGGGRGERESRDGCPDRSQGRREHKPEPRQGRAREHTHAHTPAPRLWPQRRPGR